LDAADALGTSVKLSSAQTSHASAERMLNGFRLFL